VRVAFVAAISVGLGGARLASRRLRRCSSERRDAAGHEQQHCRSAGPKTVARPMIASYSSDSL
jgi:hypothetical protein